MENTTYFDWKNKSIYNSLYIYNDNIGMFIKITGDNVENKIDKVLPRI